MRARARENIQSPRLSHDVMQCVFAASDMAAASKERWGCSGLLQGRHVSQKLRTSTSLLLFIVLLAVVVVRYLWLLSLPLLVVIGACRCWLLLLPVVNA